MCLNVLPELCPIISIDAQIASRSEAERHVEAPPEAHWCRMDQSVIDGALAQQFDVGRSIESMGYYQAGIVQPVGCKATASAHVGYVAVPGQHVPQQCSQQLLLDLPLIEGVPPQDFHSRQSAVGLPLGVGGEGRPRPCRGVRGRGAVLGAPGLRSRGVRALCLQLVRRRLPGGHDGLHGPEVRLEELQDLAEPAPHAPAEELRRALEDHPELPQLAVQQRLQPFQAHQEE
mmetsp:Transcript_56299/g.164553  ORF Transcript_56299/g.164553 Transcript_56299/m.164553 type:complete len:231 (+) Transcript_56299:264-956(+)